MDGTVADTTMSLDELPFVPSPDNNDNSTPDVSNSSDTLPLKPTEPPEQDNLDSSPTVIPPRRSNQTRYPVERYAPMIKT